MESRFDNCDIGGFHFEMNTKPDLHNKVAGDGCHYDIKRISSRQHIDASISYRLSLLAIIGGQITFYQIC